MHTDTITILKQLIGISEQLALEHYRDRSLGGLDEKSYVFNMKVLDDANRHVVKLNRMEEPESGLLSK
jgi:hypothetical protein